MPEVNTNLKHEASGELRSKGAYVKPAVVCELELETRAGTPMGPTGHANGLDPLGLNPNNNPR